VGVVAEQSYSIEPQHSITRYSYRIGQNLCPSGPRYFLKTDDEEPLRKLFKALIDSKPFVGFCSEPSEPLSIAFERYSNSILDTFSVESQLTTAIMGLEALFLRESIELSYRLAMRIAKFHSHLDDDPKSVYNDIKEAYGIRSNFVHGNKLSKEKEEGMRQLRDHVWNILRKSILYFVLSDYYGKDNKGRFIGLLDDSLIDSKDMGNLQEMIQELITNKPFSF
jgi:hypothetical protein